MYMRSACKESTPSPAHRLDAIGRPDGASAEDQLRALGYIE
jgi:hypothetical protein